MPEHGSHKPTIGYTEELAQLRAELAALRAELEEVKKQLEAHASHKPVHHKPALETK